MKNLLFAVLLSISLLFVANNSEEIAQKTPKAQKPIITGKVASLADVMLGKEVALDVKTAEGLVDKGQTLVIVSGKGKKAKVNFIMNADGSMAAKKLAKMADKELEVFGTSSVRNGINVIAADKFAEKVATAAPAKK